MSKTVSFKTSRGVVSFKARTKAKAPKAKAPKAKAPKRSRSRSRGPKRVKIDPKPVVYNLLSSRGNPTAMSVEVVPAREGLVQTKAINPRFGKYTKWFKARRIDSKTQARRAAKAQVDAAKKTIEKGIKASKAPRAVKKAQIKQLERQAQAAVVAAEQQILPPTIKVKTRPRAFSAATAGSRVEAAINYGLKHRISIDKLADRFALMDVGVLKEGIRQAKRSAKAAERAGKKKAKAAKSHRWHKVHPGFMNSALQKYNMRRHAEKMMRSGHMVARGGEVEISEQVDAYFDPSLSNEENIANYDAAIRDSWRGD